MCTYGGLIKVYFILFYVLNICQIWRLSHKVTQTPGRQKANKIKLIWGSTKYQWHGFIHFVQFN